MDPSKINPAGGEGGSTPPTTPENPSSSEGETPATGNDNPANGSQPKGGDAPGQPAAGEAKPNAPETVAKEEYNRTAAALRKAQRELARYKGKKYLDQTPSGGSKPSGTGNGEGDDEVAQLRKRNEELEFNNAVSELRTQTEELLSDYPNLPESLRKAILRNPRGFVNFSSTTVDDAILDIQDYLDEVTAGGNQTPDKKQVQVAGTNTPSQTQGDTSPAQVQAILAKPVDEWTPEERKLLEAQGAPKRQ